MRRLLSLASLLPLLGGTQAAIVSLTSLGDFNAFRGDNEGFAVLVYAPWCGHSKALLPEFEDAAASSPVPFAKVDGTEAEALATHLDIKGYPTLLFIRRGDGPPIEYDGLRQSHNIAKWVGSKHRPELKQLSSVAQVQAFTKGKSIALVLFAAEGASEVEALHSVAASASDLPCAISTSDPADSALALGDVSAPALVAFTAHDAGHAVLSSPLTHASMLNFGKAHALPAVVAYSPGEVEEKLFSADVPTHLLFFHSTAVDASVAQALQEAGASLRGRALVATIDASKHLEISSFFDIEPTGNLPTPSLVGFSLANGTKFVHKGALEAAAIVSFADTAARGQVAPHYRTRAEPPASGPLIELVGSSFPRVAFDKSKDVLVQFYSPTCGHCAKLKPVYAQVAAKFADDETMVVAQMDAVANDVAGLEPEGFPTIVLYSKSNKEGIEYDGSRDAHDLIQFVEDARAGRNHIGGLTGEAAGLDEDDGFRVEL